MKITSSNNSKVKFWVSLKRKANRDRTGLFLIEGRHGVEAACQRGLAREIITLKPWKGKEITYEVTYQIMQKISSQVHPSDLVAVCQKPTVLPIRGRVLALDGVSDPGNLGTLIRSAVAFNFSNIIMADTGVDPYNNKVIQATEGMIFKINLIRGNLKSILTDLAHQNYQIIGTDCSKGHLCSQIKFQTKCVLILGNEGQGMQTEIKKLGMQTICLKTNPECESLNVAVAGAIIMYEIANQIKDR